MISAIRRTLITISLFTCFAFTAGYASATVVGSTHDFSPSGTSGFQSTNEFQVCIFCHTPHAAVVADPGTGDKLPLWNRTLNAGATFTMYDSDTFDGKVSYYPNIASARPTGMSLLCLSCHDGVTAINSVINYEPGVNPIQMAGANAIGQINYPPYNNPNIGRDLSNDHPVSFRYNAALVSAAYARFNNVKQLNDPTPANLGTLMLWGTTGDRLECSTCHDPHEDGKLTGQQPYLRMTNTGSAMCLACHAK